MRNQHVTAALPEAGAERSAGVRWISQDAALVAAFGLLTALAGQVRIPLPFTPVPLTLQMVPVLLAGAALGPLRGAASQVVLLAAGAMGFPVFAGAAFGPAHILGATGGYLIGFVGAAWFVGRLLHADGRPGPAATFLAMLSGAALIHVFGMLHLAIFLGGDLSAAFQLGSLPFLAGDLLKTVLAAAIASAWPRRTRAARA